jgi:cbb3-type cytochrome oxidase cytochrome c subunit
MKSGALVFLVAFVALSASWAGFVLAPQLQLGRQGQSVTTGGTDAPYPVARAGQARQGAEIYRANGCVYCHSQQVGQEATHCEVVLTDLGTNKTAVLALLAGYGIKPDAALPATVAEIPGTDAADPVTKPFQKAGAKIEVHIVPTGPDIARGWGKRRSVAEDYLFDSPVQLGTRRVGPDLSNIGTRDPDINWHLRHLYAPQSEVKGSPMPPYRYLFVTRRSGQLPSPDALQLPAEFAPATGYEVIPTAKAVELAAYLASLRADAPLFDAPVTLPPPPAAPTNAPAQVAAQ